MPHPVTFREVHGRGLLVDTWINSIGPFTFAVDTGAGVTLMSHRAASAAGVSIRAGQGPSIAGVSGVVVSADAGFVQSIAIGDRQNQLPAKTDVVITDGLPRDLDGLLDPNDAFSSLGYSIDIPRHQLSAFDPREVPLSFRTQPRDGAVVAWERDGNSHRPFVQLDTGEKTLIDTGSSLGFAVQSAGLGNGSARSAVSDVGGRVSTQRVAPRTVSIGSLVLRNVPTDIVYGASLDAPAMLGLNALRPFRLRFDPLHRLIEISPSY
ncbi:MAG: retroviral-like aspartic protease family protein [Pyrinomonadaceae bacterium]